MNDIQLFRKKLNMIIFEYSTQQDKPEYINQLMEVRRKLDLYERQNALVTLDSKKSFFNKIKNFFIKPKLSKNQQNDLISIEDLFQQASNIYEEKILKPNNEIPQYGSLKPKLSEELYYSINSLCRYYTKLEKSPEGTYKMYPIEDEEFSVSKYYEELHKISCEYFKTDLDETELMKNSLEEYKFRQKVLKNDFMNNNFEPYYGTPQFMSERAEYIIECLEKIINDNNINEKNKESALRLYPRAKELLTELNNKANIINNGDKNFYKDVYKKIELDYIRIKTIEDIVSKDVQQIWEEFLTEPKNFKQGEHFAFLVHTFTNGEVKSKDITKICCTLATDKCMPIPYGDYGIICNPTMDQISTMCICDAGSWVISKEKFFDDEMPTSWQFAEELGYVDSKIFYEEPRISKLILPTTMENEIIETNLKINGEYLNYTKAPCYSEIFIINNEHDLNVPAMFSLNGKAQEKVGALQKEEGFPNICINLDINDARKMHGLAPLDLEDRSR